MKKINFKVTENEVTKINQIGDSTTGSIGQIICTFDLDPIYTDMTCVAVFNDIKIPMIRGVCYADNIPEGRCVVGVYAYSETEGTVNKRISPKPCVIVVNRGSYLEGHDPEPPTASEIERFYNLINEAISSGKLKGEKGDKGDKGEKGDPYELTTPDIEKIINQIPYASPSKRGIMSVPNGCGIIVDSDGSARVRYPITSVKSTTDDIKVVQHTGGSTDGQYDLTFNSEKYAQKSELPKKTSDLQNDSNFVSDENYIHTDNNFTAAEKKKLGSLANYDDTALKKQIDNKQDKLPTDGSDKEFLAKDGEYHSIETIKGEQGEKGENGKDGADGKNGTNGIDGIGITNATINSNNELVLSYSDGSSVNLGNVKGAKGDKGDTVTDYNLLTNIPIKNLELNTTEPTLLTDIPNGVYVVSQMGYVITSGGYRVLYGLGTELVINTYGGIKSVTVQTGKQIGMMKDTIQRGEGVVKWLTTDNISTTITDESAGNEVASAKAVYNLFNSIINGNEVLY